MLMEITVKDFMELQPGYPRVDKTAAFYLGIAVRLAKAWDASQLLAWLDDGTRRDVVLALVGYYQDIVADAGLWRAFTTLHRHRHGQPLPHYERSDDYIDYELNLDDVRYIIWYTITGERTDAILSPHDRQLERLAVLLHHILDEHYEQAPHPTELTLLAGVDLADVADAQNIYDFTYWLFWRSYLMRPSSTAALNAHRPEAHAIISNPGRVDVDSQLHDLNDRIMLSTPAGPIKLTIGQWVQLIVDGTLPEE